MTISFIDELTI